MLSLPTTRMTDPTPCGPGLPKRLAALLLATILSQTACGPGGSTEQLERARVSYADGEYRTAAIELRNVLRDEPGNLEARLLFGRVSLALGEADTAARELGIARDQGAAPDEYALDLADALLRLGDASEAEIALEPIAAEDRGSRWLTLEGERLAISGELAPAAASFREALALDPSNYRAAIGLASAAARRDSLDEARALASAAIDLAPGEPDAYVLRGGVELARQNAAAAEADLRRAADLMAERQQSAAELSNLFVLAQLQLSLRRLDALESTAARARERAPGSAVAEYAAGAADYARGRFADAVPKLQRAANGTDADARVLTLLALNHVELGNLGQAEQHARSALAQSPDDVGAVRLVAEIERRQGRIGDALTTLAGAPAAETDPTLLAMRGVLSLEAGQTATSSDLLERALRVLPGDPGLRLQLARAYFSAGRGDEAAALFEPALGEGADRSVDVAVGLLDGESPGDNLEAARARAATAVADASEDAPTLTGIALFRYAIGDRDEAREILEQATGIDADYLPARFVLAGLSMTEGDAAGARRIYEELTALAPEDWRGWLGLARIAASEQLADEARALAGRAVTASPGALAPRLFAAQLELEAGELEAARESLVAADALAPGGVALMIMLADVEYSLGNLEEARRLARVLQTDFPRQAEGFLLEANIELAAGELDGAARVFERWLDRSPDDSNGWFLLGQNQEARNRAGEALASYERVLELDPNHVGALNNAAWLYAKQRDERALEYGRLAHALAPGVPEIEDTYGWALLEIEGDVGAALPLLRAAAEGIPDSGDVQYHLAVALAEAGAAAEARERLERLLQSGSAFSYRDQATTLLESL